MQSNQAIDLQAMAIRLLYEKEQETMRLLTLVQNPYQALLAQHQQQQALIAQQQQSINQLEAELRACRSAQQQAFGLVHTN
ncbi:hypothetical protein [Spirosoma rhododendri]|uniref:Uncharacterized protein n=1 Tax=Spirosoma rhododendri TaxID=2728024 RepID=A0A7L5DSZ9_9BACT|nr:hypothetical protein [Spirosoma rhododendri]QJD81556.1 hypothetical protein HH216_24625 [Spirosoma rhododendri]